MTEDAKKDYNILLLKVLAHDLLAPLTAVKWQAELLRKNYKKKDKRERYLGGIENSTELGISLTKHAHVAAKVLSQSYELEVADNINLGALIGKTVQELAQQYERHALELKTAVAESVQKQSVDASLLSLYVWSLGKFYLSSTPPHITVNVNGEVQSEAGYTLNMFATGVPEGEACAQAFDDTVEFDAYDQKYVFATLMKEVAPMINAKLEAHYKGDTLEVITTFS